MSRDVGVVIPAAGMGHRLGGVRKPFLELAGVPVLQRTLAPFLAHPRVGWIALALAPEELAAPPVWLRRTAESSAPAMLLCAGGAERGDSVRAAIAAIPAEAAVLLVHDAARPLITAAVIDRTLDAVARGTGAVAAVALADTIKQVDDARRIVATPDRSRLWSVQTPQAFPAAMLRSAYARAAQDGVNATDDAALVERYGGTVIVVEGAPENFKITTPFDIRLAEALLVNGS